MSPAAVALAVGLHVAAVAALWWISPLRSYDHSETSIDVTLEPEAQGGGMPASGSAAASTDPASPAELTTVAAPAQQALATPAAPVPSRSSTETPEPAASPPPPPPSEAEAETAWHTDVSSWKPQVTYEQAAPTAEAPPPPPARDIARPQRPQPVRPPVQRAQTAVPLRPAPPPSTQPAGERLAAAGRPGPANSSMGALAGHGGERNDYLTRVFRHIEPFRTYPEAARAARQRGRVVSRVTINRAGELIDLSVDRSSGWPMIDKAELAAIRRAMPLPPPPAGMPGDPIVLILPMTYNYESR